MTSVDVAVYPDEQFLLQLGMVAKVVAVAFPLPEKLLQIREEL
jgi:hypothetical protein